MKALVLKNNEEFIIEERALPSIGNNQCLVKIYNVGICSSDISRSFDRGAYNYPLILGHEISGRVVQVGRSVKNIQSGQKVSIFPLLPCFKCEQCTNKNYVSCESYSYYGSRQDGGLCEYLAVNEWNCVPLKESISYNDACLIEPLSVVIHAINKAGKISDKTNILLIGCGFLGLLLAKILNNLYPDNSITICDRNDAKLKILSGHKFNECILVNKETGDLSNSILKNQHYDIVFELTGVSSNFEESIKLCNTGGKIVWIGNIDNDVYFDRNTISSILRREITINGSWNSNFKNNDDDWQTSINYINNNVIKPSQLITESLALEETSNILRRMNNHKKRISEFNYIKFIVKIYED